jgi:hypothetical protein
MFSTLRTRFGIPGVISVIALVFAMLGGAYAANNSSSGGKATASAKAKKGPRGPKGPKGDAGPAGPQGPVGPAGPKGDAGSNGSNGTNGQDGKDGKDGEGVTISAYVGPECEEGSGEEGAKFTNASGTAYACNGAGGSGGGGGFPATLPPGATETGSWNFAFDGTNRYSTISFPIPLSDAAAASASANRAFVARLGGGGGFLCTGSVAEPTAVPGALCIYTSNFGTTFEPGNPTKVFKFASGEEEGVSTTGALTYWEFPESLAVGAHSSGTFAVTAPEAP